MWSTSLIASHLHNYAENLVAPAYARCRNRRWNRGIDDTADQSRLGSLILVQDCSSPSLTPETFGFRKERQFSHKKPIFSTI